MGFDNECILNIQSLAGEYFCPVCRTLVYPNEALQSQCTHLYCKPCLTYLVGTTQACPYDGYLVTEADSKPLIESNKALAETIHKIVVRCLYHKSGCTWQGPLSECTSHCSGCAFGNSPVVCNRCGVQIVHRQVQEHAQSCSGVNPQAQQATDSVQDAATAGTATPADQSQIATQSGAPTSQAQTSQTAAAPPQQANVNPQVHAVAPAVAPTQDQWYQQQYQQYPAYDPYQQPYQHYYPYQQQISQHPPYVQGQHQHQVYTQAQPQPQAQLQPQQPQPQPQAHLQPLPQPLAQPQPQPHPHPHPHQPQPQLHSQPQPQMPPHGQSQPHLFSQAPLTGGHHGQTQVYPQQINPAVQPHAQVQLQAHTPSHGHLPPPPQPHPQAQPHPQPHSLQPHPQHMQMPQYHQPHSHMQHLQLQNQLQPNSQAQLQLQPQPHLQGQPQAQVQNHPQPHTQPNPPQLSQAPIPNAQPQSQQPSAPAVTGHHSYPQLQSHQQMHPGATQQQSVPVHPFGGSLPPAQMHGQFPQPPPQMLPPQSHAVMPNQQPALWVSQGQVPSNPAAQHQQINPHQQPGHLIHQRPLMQQQINSQQYVQQPFPGQTSGLVQSHQHGQFAQQQPMRSQAHPQAPPHSMQQNPLPHLQPQQSVALAHGMHPQHSQNYAGRPVMVNHGQQAQPLPQSHCAFGGAALVRPTQVISNQPSGHQNYEERSNNQLQVSSEQQFVSERGVVEQQTGSTSQKIAEKDAKGPGAASPDVNAKALNSETGMKVIDDEHKSINEGEDNSRQDKTLEMNADFEVHLAKDGSREPLIKKTVKEEGNDRVLSSLPGGKSVETEAVQGKDAIDITLKQDEHPLDDSSVRQVEPLEANKAKLLKDAMEASVQASTGTDRGSQTVPPVFASNADVSLHNVIPQGNSLTPRFSGDSSQRGYQVTRQGPGFDKSGGLQGNGSAHYSHRDPVNDQGRSQLPSMPYGPSTHQQRPPVSMLHSGPPPGPPSNVQVPGYPPNLVRTQRPGHLPQRGPPLNPTEHFQPPVLKQPGSFHPDIPHGGVPGPGSTLSLGRGLEHFGHPHRSSDLQSAPQGQYNQGRVALSDAGSSKTSQGETLGGPPLGALPPGSFPPGGIVGRAPPHGPEGQIGRERPTNPLESELFPNQRPWHVDGRHPNSHVPGSLERGPFGQSSGIESNAIRINEAAGLDPSGLGLRDERFKTLTEERLNKFPMGPTCHGEFEDGLKQFPRPSHMGTEASSKVASYLSSRPVDKGPDGFGMDEAVRRLDKLPHGFHYDAGLEMDRDDGAPLRFLPSHRSGASFHPSDAGDRALTIGLHEDNSGRDSSRAHPDILGPVPLFGRHHMERWTPRIPGREHLDIPSRGFGGELDGPRNLRTGEHVRSGELGAGPGSFPNNVPLGESFGNKSSHPRLGGPGFRSSYLIQGFPNDDGIYAGDYNSFDKLRKRKPTSAGWCRICKVDCETVEGLDVHSQTREHQKMAMDMVISIKKKNAKKHKRFNTHSSLDDASKSRSRSAGFKARDTKA